MQRPSSPHALLAPPPAQYNAATVRRALVVWTRAGRRNAFQDVCRFYHYLEEKESALPEDQRISSQRQDYEQLSTSPPTAWQQNMFPSLYPPEPPTIPELTQRQGITGATPDEIVAVSEMIKGYCLDHKTSLREFLSKFSDYASKYSINPTVSNVAFFIQYQKVLEKERNSEELKQKCFKPIDDRYIREEMKIEDDGTPRYELFHEQAFSLHNVLKEIIHVDQTQNKNDAANHVQCNNADKDIVSEEFIKDLIDWTDPIDNINFGIKDDLLNDIEIYDAVEFDTDDKTMTYAKVTGNKPRTCSSMVDSKINQHQESIHSGYENIIDSNIDQIDSIHVESIPEINIDENRNDMRNHEAVEPQQEIANEVIEVPVDTQSANSTKPEVQETKLIKKPPNITEKKNKKTKKNKKIKELETNKENVSTNTTSLVEIPFKLKSSEMGGYYFRSHQDKEICNKISTKIGVLKKNDHGNVMKENGIEGHVKYKNENKSLSEEYETFYSIREDKDAGNNSQERSEYVSIEDSKPDDLWTLDFTNFEAKAKVLKELFNRDLLQLESLESDTSNLSGEFESLKTQRFSTSSE